MVNQMVEAELRVLRAIDDLDQGSTFSAIPAKTCRAARVGNTV